MTRSQVREIIWSPGDHALPDVAQAAELILGAPAGDYTGLDLDQASYLLATFARLGTQQYVEASEARENLS